MYERDNKVSLSKLSLYCEDVPARLFHVQTQLLLTMDK